MNNTLELQIKTAADGAIQSVKVLNQNLDVTNKNLINASSNISKAFSFGGAYASMKKFGKSVISMMNDIVNRTEELNLFNVVFKNTKKDGKQMFSELGQEAIKFQNTLNQKFGTNMTESLRYQSLYQSMGENVGIDPKYAAIISENTTKFAYDLASLYNTSEKSAADALKSGVFAGQVKPMRNYGVDLTEKSLSGTLLALGITDRTISQMSQAEKEILRYITTLNQARIAMGDFADNIESPANQMKILNNLLTECKVAISSLFIGTFAKILPYINAFLMVIKNIAYSLATLFGIEIRDYNSGISGLGEDFVGIEDAASSAADAVKELKRQTLGFDQINNLTEDNSKNNGYGSGGISGGIDQRLLDAITGYDNKMKDIKSKAQEISENIMKWLGFTSETDATTEELSWKFDHITGGTVLGALAVGGTIFLGIKKIFDIVKKIVGINPSKGSLLGNLFGGDKSKKSDDIGGTLEDDILATMGGTENIGEAASKVKFELPSFGTIIKAIGELALVIAACTAIVAAYGALNKIEGFSEFMTGGIDILVKTFEGIGKIVLPLIGISAVIAGLGIVSPVILEGIGALALVVGGVGLIVAAFGGLAKIEGISEFMSGGIDLLCTIFEGIGKIAGILIGGFIEGISIGLQKSLEGFGTSLSNFMKNASGFFDAVSNYGATTFDSVGNLAKALLNITKAELLNSLLGWITGDNPLAKFGEQLSEFGPYFQKFASSISSIGKDTTQKTQLVADSMIIINDFAKKIPNSGGVLGFFAGNNDIDKFGQKLATFGTNFANYSKNISKTDGGVVSNSEKVKLAMDYIIEFAKRIPNEGGVAAFFAGDNGIDTFGSKLASFGKSFAEYSNSISKIDTGKVNNVSESMNKIVSYFKTVKDNKLVDTVKDFAKAIKNSSGDISSFLNTTFNSTTGWNLGYTFGTNIGSGIKSGIKNNLGTTLEVSSNGNSIKKYSIKAYANGGFPEDGFFYANHNELVGNFANGKTAVANNKEITAGIEEASYRGYMRAIQESGLNSSGGRIELYAHTDEGVIIDRINQKTNQTGVCPINIPY